MASEKVTWMTVPEMARLLFTGWFFCIYVLDIYTQARYNQPMIKTFADKETEKVYHQIFSKNYK